MEYYEHLYFGIYMQSIQDMYDLIPLTWPVLMYTYKILWNQSSLLVGDLCSYVAFVGNPCQQIYIPTNLYAIIC